MVVLAPVLVAASFVVTVYADSGTVLEALSRPLLVAVGGAIVTQLACVALLRHLINGSIAAVAVVAIVIDVRFVAIAACAVLIAVFLRRTGRRPLTSRAVGLVAWVLFVLAVGRLAISPAFDLSDLAPGNSITPDRVAGPNIYLLMLDAYPREDTLLSYGLDNEPFSMELARMGFSLYPESQGSYQYTTQVLASMLNMKHLDEIDRLVPPPPSKVGQARALRQAVRFGSALQVLEQNGYRTVSTGFPSSVLTLRGVDEYIDRGDVTMFEHQVLRRTSLWPWVDEVWALPQLQSQVVNALDVVGQVAAQDSDRPVFVFAHVFGPHTPFVFDRSGQIPRLSCDPECERWTFLHHEMPIGREEYEAAYADQVRYLNGLVLSAIDTIVTADPEAVVVVFSDHGARAEEGETDEWYRTFFAARTPGHPALFEQNPRAIAIFPSLFRAYFDHDVPIPSDVTFRSKRGLDYPLDVQRISAGG
jgi:hypothetical protein